MKLKYYLLINGDGKSHGVHRWDGTSARRLGISQPEAPDNNWTSEGEESFQDLMKRVRPAQTEGCSFHELILRPGEYYPRMARPSDSHLKDGTGTNPNMRGSTEAVAHMQGQLESLVGRLKDICQTVLPTESNFPAYGHEIRNLLILACTEVESHWRSILLANGYPEKSSYHTGDYVKLSGLMRLDEYSVLFSRYPWLPKQSPFKDWGKTECTTKDIPWYDAYNAVKHAREENFDRATLEHCLQAVAACAIMNCAQAGRTVGLGNTGELKYFFEFSQYPDWPPSEVYSPNYEDRESGMRPVKHPCISSRAT